MGFTTCEEFHCLTLVCPVGSHFHGTQTCLLTATYVRLAPCSYDRSAGATHSGGRKSLDLLSDHGENQPPFSAKGSPWFAVAGAVLPVLIQADTVSERFRTERSQREGEGFSVQATR